MNEKMSESERPATGASGGDAELRRMLGEALGAVKELQQERDAAERELAGISRISDSEMIALLRRRATYADTLEKDNAALAAENEQLKARCEGLEAQVSRCSSCGEVMPNVPNLFCSAGCAG